MDMSYSENATNFENSEQDSILNVSSSPQKGPPAMTINEQSLKREMADILRMMTSYLKDIEAAAKTRRIKRTNHVTGDYKDFCKGEKRFLTRLEYGKGIMRAIMESLHVVPDVKSHGKLVASDLYARINDFVRKSGDGSTAENMEEMSFYLSELMMRFARICESEGFQHGLPITAYPPPVINKEKTYIYQRKIKKILQEGEEYDRTDDAIKTIIDGQALDSSKTRLSSEGIPLCDVGTDAKGPHV